MSDDLMVICTFSSDVEADLADAVLSTHGIDAIFIRDSAMGMMPWLNTLHPIRLAVKASDAELALQLLRGADDTRTNDSKDGSDADVPPP